MKKQDIINVFEFVKYNQLRTLQLETEKTEAMEHLFKLKRMIGESENTLAQKRREIARMDRESKSDNTGNSCHVTHTQNQILTKSHSIE
jgi:hypothetical protein